MPVKLIIFDLDGTLVDTAADIAEALNRAIRPFGAAPLSAEQTAALIGEGTSKLVAKALGPALLEHHETALKSFLDYYSTRLCVHSAPYPGVRDTLWRLSAFQKVVLSNKRESLSVGLLQDLGLAEFFTHIKGSDVLGSKKPSPEPVFRVLALTGTAAADALMVGDSPYDVQAARAAGVASVAVTYGYRDRGLLQDADHVIEEFSELIPLLIRLKAIDEKRHEPRYRVPQVMEQYIDFLLLLKDGQLPAVLMDFSRHGIMFHSPVEIEPDSPCECELSMPRALSKAVRFSARVKHCEPYQDGYLCGAEVEEVHEEIWFRVFRKTMDFISERAGEVY